MKIGIEIIDSNGEKRKNTWIVNDELSKSDKKRVINKIEVYLGEFIK